MNSFQSTQSFFGHAPKENTMFAKFFRFVVALILFATTSQASAQVVARECNLIQGGPNGPYQQCFSGGGWIPDGYRTGYNVQPGIPALFPSSIPVNVPAGYRRQECDPETYIGNMTRKAVGGAVVGAIVGVLAGDSREAAGKGAAAGALVGIANSLQCFILVKNEEVRTEAKQKKSHCESGELAKNDQDGTLWCVVWQDRAKGLIASRAEPINN